MIGFKRWAVFLPVVALSAFTVPSLVCHDAKSGQAEAAIKQAAQQQPKAQDAKQEQPKAEEIERITVDELILMLAKKKPVTIIDTRNPDSYDKKIKGALQIPVDETEAHLKEIPRDKEIVTYCA